MNAFGNAAGALARMGYSPIPLSPETGLPAMKGWDKLRVTPLTERQIAWRAGQNPDLVLGVVGGFNGLIPIDVDTDDPAIWAAIKAVLPEPKAARRGSKGYVLFYQDPTGVIASDAYQGPRNFLAPDKSCVVEVKARGNVTIPPSPHRKTGKAYTWVKGSLFDLEPRQLTIITPGHLVALEAALAPWCPPRPVYVPSTAPVRTGPVSDKRMQRCAEVALDRAVSRVASTSKGRNGALYSAARSVGKFVAGRYLNEHAVVSALLGAAASNGSIRDHSLKQCQLTVASGLKKGSGDKLPDLPDEPNHSKSTHRRSANTAKSPQNTGVRHNVAVGH